MTHSNLVPTYRSHALLVLLGLCLGMTSGCFKSETVLDGSASDGGSRLANSGGGRGAGKSDAGAPDGGPRFSYCDSNGVCHDIGNHGDVTATGPDGGSDTANTPNAAGLDSICGSHARCVTVNTVDKVDLLFVVDNSNSMKEEQGRLGSQFDKLIGALTTGKGAGGAKFTPASLHLGVVSSDMGLPGVDKVEKCRDLGDDGLLLHAPTMDPSVSGCAAQYPKFLSVNPGDDVASSAHDLQCIATLGTDGCGFEQQLEAGLKAVWPASDGRITFLTDPRATAPRGLPLPMTMATFDGGTRPDGGGSINPTDPLGTGMLGHGDRENAGFVRTDVTPNTSLLAVVVLSDEDDGSSNSVQHLIPKQFLDPNDQRYNEPLNLRNFYHKDELYPITRYVAGLQALHPDAPDLVVFGAIVGAPPELVDAVHTQDVGTNPMVREAFYDTLLHAPKMQETVDPASTMTPGSGNLLPSCETTDLSGVPNGKAYPPQRFVQVAQGFGANGFVDSLCTDDLSPAIDQLVDRIGARLGSGCLDEGLPRADDGLVPDCRVLWQLPAGPSPAGTPTTCQDGGAFLKSVGASYPNAFLPNDRLCEVTQLPVLNGAVGPESSMMGTTGWYYDDFSKDAGLCMRSQRRIAFTVEARLRPGVQVILDCK